MTDNPSEPIGERTLPELSYPHWRHNFVANFVDSAFFSLGLAFASMTTIVPLFIRELGGSALLVGLLPAVVQAGQMLPPLFAAPYIAPLERKLPFLLKLTLGERLPWPLLALLAVLLAPRYPTVMLVITALLMAIFGLSGGIVLPAWMDIVARVTPLNMRGKLFGWSGAASGLMGVAGGLGAERALASFSYPYNFAACFLAAGVCMQISFLGLAALKEPPATERTAQARVGAYLRQAGVVLRQDPQFMRFILVRLLGALAAMAVAFVAVYATEQRGLQPSLAGRFTAAMLGTQVLTTPLFGMLADRRGYKLSLQFALLAQALAMTLTLVVTDVLGFSIVFGLLGASTGLFFTTALNMVVEFASDQSRVTYLGLHGTLIAPAILLAPLLGGWLAEAGGYELAFVVAAGCGLAALALLTFGIRDPRHRQLVPATST